MQLETLFYRNVYYTMLGMIMHRNLCTLPSQFPFSSLAIQPAPTSIAIKGIRYSGDVKGGGIAVESTTNKTTISFPSAENALPPSLARDEYSTIFPHKKGPRRMTIGWLGAEARV